SEDGDKSLVAYVVPESGSRLASLPPAAEQIAQWENLFDSTYTEYPTDHDPTFNISGWNSSYDGQPIPAGEMHEWVDQAVSRILAHHPRRVFEIGLGTGLLFFRVAPHCQEYWGTDFSAEAVQYVKRHSHLLGESLPDLHLRRALADDFQDVPPGFFDLVVINSVTQYFPDV